MLLNINLAIINMLPIPVLDGGHIMMAIIERIRRRPLSAQLVEYTTTAFAVLLISLHALRHVLSTSSACRFSEDLFNRETQIEQAAKPAPPASQPRIHSHALLRFAFSFSPPPDPRSGRRRSRHGGVIIGGDHPVVKQSMLTCDTMDTAECVKQTLELVAVGCQIVRITAPTVKDAANLKNIVAELRARGCNVPIVADIHFKPDAAMEAAKWVEMVRVNPGNYADKKKFAVREYSDEQYAAELAALRSNSPRW